MKLSIDYLRSSVAEATLDIEDASNCALKLYSSTNGLEFVVIVRTELGETYMLTYGPRYIDLTTPPDYVMCSVEKFTFNANRIYKALSKLLNNPFNHIDQAMEVTREEALEDIGDLTENFRKESIY